MRNTLVKKILLSARQQRFAGWTHLRNNDAGEGDGGAGAGAEGDDGEETDEESDQEGKETDTSSREKTVSEAKYLQVKKHLSESDRKRQAAENELKQLRQKDLPEAEKLKADYEDAVKERDEYQGKFTTLARTNAFLMASQELKVNWVNAKTALKVGDFDDLEIAPDGSIPEMESAVKKLMKDHPYLVTAQDTGDEEDTKTRVKSGSVVGGKKTGKKTEQELSEQDLRRRFPALY